MGSVGGEEEFPAGVTGADAEVGALVWVRRRNGSWWPGRILGQDELPENCVVPPRSAGTPIKLLGRPDGSIDWYNLEKSKRVKAFRCGEYEECIEKAKYLAYHQKRTYNEGKYVRREDAIMHALEIERSRFPNEGKTDNAACASQNSYSAKSMNINGSSKRSSRIARDLYDIEENSAQGLSQDFTLCKLPQNLSSSSTRYASSSRKKRKASNNFKGDMAHGYRRMRDLGEIGSMKVPKQKSSSYVFSNGHQGLPLLESGPSFGYDLSSTNGIRKSKQSHSLTKRKRSNIGQAYENARKKDRRRPLSKLCTDSAVTAPAYCPLESTGQSSVQYPGHKPSSVFESSRGKSALLMDVNSCSYRSGPSSSGTLADTLCTNRSGAAKAFHVKEVEISHRTGFSRDDCSDGDEFSDAPLTMDDDVLEEGHLYAHRSCASIKGQILKPKMQTTEYSEESIPSFCDNTSSKKKSKMTVKCEAPSEDVNGYDVSFCKRTDLQNSMEHAVFPADGCAGVMEQQSYEGNPEHEESSETISNHSHSEKVAAAPPYYGLPLEGILHNQKLDLKSVGCNVAKTIKTVRADCKLYDVELTVEGSYKGHRAPLVSLMSKWNGKPIVGFPIPVQVLDDSCPVESSDDQGPETSSLNHLLKRSEFTEPRQPRSHASRSRPSGRKKISEQDMDKSWRPHTKRSESSPRKMRRLSSFASSRRESANRKPVARKMCGATIACIPLQLVFSRINEALNLPLRSENPT